MSDALFLAQLRRMAGGPGSGPRPGQGKKDKGTTDKKFDGPEKDSDSLSGDAKKDKEIVADLDKLAEMANEAK